MKIKNKHWLKKHLRLGLSWPIYWNCVTESFMLVKYFTHSNEKNTRDVTKLRIKLVSKTLYNFSLYDDRVCLWVEQKCEAENSASFMRKFSDMLSIWISMYKTHTFHKHLHKHIIYYRGVSSTIDNIRQRYTAIHVVLISRKFWKFIWVWVCWKNLVYPWIRHRSP